MAKRLIVCLDGTWNSPDQGHATNVVKIMRAIAPVDDRGVAQVAFYDAGIGADGGKIDRVVDGITGRGLEQNVRDGYRFLANNWVPGDEIYVFGFSRGAFTARSLCGFIALVGLLPKREMDRLGDAWQLYCAKRPDEAAVARIRSESRQGAKVKCLGVWDTVGALGVPGPLPRLLGRKHRFHNTELSKVVECAFHALAIDEKRGTFGPVLWRKREDGSHEQKVIEQVWFPGAHSDVGGGDQGSGLSAAALSWMIRRVQAHSELAFDEDYIDEHVTPDALGEIRDSRSALYVLDRIRPFLRPIGQRPVKGSLLRRLLPRRTDEGGELVNEMIHWSAVARFGRMALEDGEPRRYAPENLKAALGRLPLADERRQGPATAPAPVPAPLPGPGARADVALAEI
jgi:hypothetical protein